MKMAAFRDPLAHAYERLNYAHVLGALKHSLTDLQEFVENVKCYV